MNRRPPRITLRPASAEDREFAFRVRRAAFRGALEAAGGWDESEQRMLHERRFAEQEFRVVVVDGADVGILATAETSEAVKLNQLMLLPGYQGRGIGRECARRVVDEARRLGRPVRLRVLRGNTRARAFFERLGFERVGDTPTHVRLERGHGDLRGT